MRNGIIALCGLLLVVSTNLPATERHETTPLIGPWRYIVSNCSTYEHEWFPTLEQAITFSGNHYHHEVRDHCSWSLGEVGPWGTPEDPVRGVCGSAHWYPKFFPVCHWNTSYDYEDGIECSNALELNTDYITDGSEESCSVEGSTGFTATRYRVVECPPGFLWNIVIPNQTCQRVDNQDDPFKHNEPDCPINGTNPINASQGYKIQIETDFKSPEGVLSFIRRYSSNSHLGSTVLGRNWRHNWDKRLAFHEAFSTQTIVAFRENHNRYYFTSQDDGVSWFSEQDVELDFGPSLNMPGTSWVLTSPDGSREWYTVDGLLAKVRFASGQSANLAYNEDGRLLSVADRRGRSLYFSYDGSGRLVEVVSGNLVLTYTYNSDGLLSHVGFSDGANVSDKAYLYEVENSEWLLTGLVDETGTRVASWDYYSSRRAKSSRAGGPESTTDVYSINYHLASGNTFRAHVTNPLGGVTSYTYAKKHGKRRITRVSNDCSTCANGGQHEYSYDDRGFLEETEDFRGFVTSYQRDDLGQELTRIEADGSSAEREVSTDWQADFRKPTRRTEGNQQRDFAYNSSGQLVSMVETDLQTSESRVLQYSYYGSGDPDYLDGAIESVENERGFLTLFDYYDQDSANGHFKAGDLESITNPLGHTTEYLEYDSAGRPVRIRDANGVDTVMTYHARGWLLSRSIGSATTTFSYLPNGLVSRVAQPDGTYLDFEYDIAQRLSAIQNALGHRIEYDLDAAGNRTAERILDASSNLRHEVARVYDQLGRLDEMINGLSHHTDYDYDAASNLSDITDPLNNSTGHEYDPLNRLIKTLDALGGETEFEYDERNNLTQVTDPEGLSTTYTYNAFGDLIGLESPDTGVTIYTYDSAGNRTSQTDARGVIATFTYDALNRLLSAQYPDSSLNVSYFYDEPISVTGCKSSYSIGRLTRLVDASGTTTWCYDELGNVLEKKQSNASLSVSYTYSAAGRVQAMTLPSGHRVSYKRDSDGEISEITVGSKYGARPSAFVSAIERAPFGPAEEVQFGSGRTLSFTLEANYQVTEVSSDGLDLSFDRDPVGNIVDLLDPVLQSPVEQYDYDNLYRLEEVADAGGAVLESYTYDLIGNRQQKQSASGLETYTYPLDSHRLIEVGPDIRTYDAMGNMLSRKSGSETFTYDQRGRLVQYSGSGQTTNYTHNGLGQRVGKVIQASFPQQASYFLYDESGRLLSEYRPVQMGLGVYPWREYIWTDDRLVGVIDELGNIHEVHTDHLGTPRAVVADDGTLLWTWQFDQNPFGEAAPNEDPESSGSSFELNLRFPGQYYDAESGLHYNYFRDYEPGVGRYVQSDPIGLEGGASTYLYVAGNPLVNIDPFGLDYWVEGADPSESGLGLHQSICVGSYGSNPFCVSFGRKPGQGECWFDCEGHVYPDRSPAGPIIYPFFRKTSSATDKRIRTKLQSELYRQGRWDAIGGQNCRKFSKDMFWELVSEFGGESWPNALMSGSL